MEKKLELKALERDLNMHATQERSKHTTSTSQSISNTRLQPHKKGCGINAEKIIRAEYEGEKRLQNTWADVVRPKEWYGRKESPSWEEKKCFLDPTFLNSLVRLSFSFLCKKKTSKLAYK